MNINQETSSAEKAIEMIPDVFFFFLNLVKKDKKEEIKD